MKHLVQARSIQPYHAGRPWWKRLAGSSLFAWTVSVALHGGLFLILYDMVLRETAQPRRTVIPEARLAGASEPFHSRATSLDSLNREPIPPPAETPALPLDEFPPLAAPLEALSALALPVRQDQNSVAPAASATAGLVPATSLFGQAGNAYRIVYVVDVSASLTLVYGNDLVTELRRSIRDLLPTQRFHIILTRRPGDLVDGSELEELEPRRLVPGNGQYKTQAMSLLDSLGPEPGKALVNRAMGRAFEVGPELIYLLSDGDFEDELEPELERLNANGQVKITVIAIAAAPARAAMLERVARRHGGNFRVVTVD